MIDAFLAQHAGLAVAASLLMLAVLPGFLVWRILGLEFCWLAWPGLLAISLVANFQLVFYLTLCGAYRVEALALAGLLCLAASATRVAAQGFVPAPPGARASAAPGQTSAALTALLVVLALASLAILAMRMAAGFTGVFEAWDAVVSWNRWAADWHRGIFPRNTYGYPQLIPAAWASTYQWLGSARIEFAAKALMALFPLAVATLFIDLYARTRWPAALAALAVWPMALLRVFPEIVDSGYVDVPAAFFILLCAHLLFLAGAGRLARAHAWPLAALCAAGAVLTKQAGWLAFALLLAALAAGWRRRDGAWRRDALRALAAFALLAGPALAYQYHGMWSGRDPGNFTYVTSTIYAGEPVAARLARAALTDAPRMAGALLPGPAGIALVAVLMLAALRLPAGRRCWLGVVLPCSLVWAMYFSYDLRNFMPAVPFVCLGLGLGLQSLAQALRLHREAPLTAHSAHPAASPAAAPRWAPAALLALLAASLLSPLTRADLLRSSEARRLASGDAPMNAALLEYGRSQGFAGKILTTHAPVARIPGLQEHFFFLPERPSLSAELVMAMKQNRPICHIIGLMPRGEEIRYLVLHAGVLAEAVDRALAGGELRLLHATAQLRFLEIRCPGQT